MPDGNRQHERRRMPIEFNCYHQGNRFDAVSVDVSLGGAFLQTKISLPQGAVVLIVPKKAQTNSKYRRAGELPVLLAGMVVRRQGEPFEGLGVQWIKCISRAGMQPLYDFLAFIVGRFPHTLPLPEPIVSAADNVVFDFRRNEFQLVQKNSDNDKESARDKLETAADEENQAASDEPQQDERVIEPSPSEVRPLTEHFGASPPGPVTDQIMAQERERHQNPGKLTEMLGEYAGRVTRPTAVVAVLGRETRNGVIRDIGLSSLNIVIPGPPADGLTKMKINFPIPFQRRTVKVELDCQIDSSEFDERREATWYEIFIESVRGEVPGIFPRYIKFLFQREIFQPQRGNRKKEKKPSRLKPFQVDTTKITSP